MDKEFLFLIFWIFSNITSINSYTYKQYSCSASGVPDYLGVNTPSIYNAGVNTADTGRLYFVEDYKYWSRCCGIITSWEFHALATGTLELVVWRRVAGTEWMITGKNRIYVSSTGSHTYDPSTSTLGDYRISIQPGDYIGWYSLGNDVISYATSSSKLTRVRPSVGSISVGDITDWSLYTVDSIDRDYAIKANIAAGSTPTLDTIGTITMLDSTVAGTVIHTVTYNNVDQNDAIYVGLQSQSSAYFKFNTKTYEISPGYSYIPEGSYTMTLVIQDQCENEATETLTIEVTNVAVTIDNIPSGTLATIDEALDTQKTLYSIITTDNSVEDFTYCVLGNSAVGPFVVEQNDAAVQTYDINVQDRPQFVYDTTSEYLLQIECDDGSNTATSTFTVNIEKNQVPYFTNTDWSVEIDATALGIGSVIFTLTASDNEGDNLYYGITCNPSGCPFVLLDSGKIVTSGIMIHNSDAVYTLSVTVNDSRQTSEASYIAVKINNINSKPVLNNVPTTLSVAENTALGSTLYTFTSADDNSQDTLLMSMYFSGGEAASIFSFNPTTGVLTTSPWNSIDYEELSTRTFTTTISVGDGKFYETRTFTLNVENVNEAPFFLQKYYATYQLEGADQTSLPLPSYNYKEPDGQTVTFTLDCGTYSGRFTIDDSTGELSYKQEYDLDTINVMTEVICTVKITDPAGLFDTAELAIHIDHDNEYDPQFTIENFYFYVDSTEFIGEIIGQVYATESDGSDTDHGIFYYTLDQSSLSKEYFGIMNNGKLYVKESLSDLYLGQILVVFVTATDYSGRNKTISVNIEVPTFTTKATVSVDDPKRSFITSPENMPLLVGGCTLFGVIGVLAAWLLTQYGLCNSLSCLCRKPPKMESLLETEEPSSEDPKLFKKTLDQKVLDQMFGIEETKPPEETDF